MRILLIVAVSSGLFGQDVSSLMTQQMANGRFWEASTAAGRFSYVAGLHDAIVQSMVLDYSALLKPQTADTVRWAVGFSARDYIEELTKLYRDRENLLIPIPFALDWCTAKLKGKSTKEELEKSLIYLRGLFAKSP